MFIKKKCKMDKVFVMYIGVNEFFFSSQKVNILGFVGLMVLQRNGFWYCFNKGCCMKIWNGLELVNKLQFVSFVYKGKISKVLMKYQMVFNNIM